MLSTLKNKDTAEILKRVIVLVLCFIVSYRDAATRPRVQTSYERHGKCKCNETNMYDCYSCTFTNYCCKSHRKHRKIVKITVFVR